MIEFLKGKKTYILGAVGIAWAIVGWALGYLDDKTVQQFIWAGLTAMALRAGITKNVQ